VAEDGSGTPEAGEGSGAPTAGEGSGAVDIMTSHPPPMGWRRVFVRGHHHHVCADRASLGWWLQ
jgi:hypothetical protein